MNRILDHAERVRSLQHIDGSSRRAVRAGLTLPISQPRVVELHIEQLVLHGFAPSDRQLIGEAVQRELASLFENQELPSSISQDGEIGRVDGGAFSVSPGGPVARVGTQIANAVFGGLSRR